MAPGRIRNFYRDNERHFSSIALFGGFIFDILTLRRADSFWENFWVILHLTIVGSAILLLNRRGTSSREESRVDFWLVNILQFSIGGLLSAFLILYFRSATFSVSWPLLLLLATAFIANERLRHQYSRQIYQISFLFFALFLYLIFLVPLLLRSMGPLIFILSGILSIFIIRYFLRILIKVSEGRALGLKTIWTSILSIFVAINVLYFTNIIPPIPLLLSEGGIYHLVDRTSAGYLLRGEEMRWYEHLSPYQKVHITPGQRLYAYTAVSSPAEFNTTIIHEWEFFDEIENRWESVSRVPLSISGGRELGFRTYSILNVSPGRYRVEVEMEDGRVLGRIQFIALESQIIPLLKSEVR